ncbi:DNA-directed DNA polymerase [Polymorphobacter glacialis]|uniref:DNA-directed DNA polymerase n=1 Tax=Sandarakinorhabdus glacialis TaxID=1614636 RepID=A0A916ZRN1_9SPHN|nr:DNA polymerase Y family protein [Polymorphobacter glacialis]GGE09397.1 DNA-directed DNA polymerase [Polymorphobacter glacialis]
MYLPLLSSERIIRSRIRPSPESNAPPEPPPFALVAREKGAIILAAVDAKSQAQGLAPGMTLADSRARVPALVSIAHEPAADLALLEWLADGCDRYTPMVMAMPPLGLVLDITGCTHPYGGEAGLVDDLLRRLAKLGLTGWPALANTPDAALALARHRMADVGDLPSTALEVAESTHLALRRAGLKHITDVAKQHRPALAARFGKDMTDRLARLLGEVDIHITPRRAPTPIEAEQRFAAPLAHSDAALAVIETLAVRAGLQLTERAEGGRRFDVALFRSDGHVARLGVDTANPVRDPKLLIRLLRDRIGGLSDPLDPGFGYDLIRLSVPVTAPLAASQLLLEGGTLAEGEIGALVDRLTTRLGRNRVRRMIPADSHIPEQAAFDLALADSPFSGNWPAVIEGDPPWRPLQLFDPPQIIQVIAEVPDGPPRRFRWRRRLHEVTRHEGPERIAAQWWRRADGAGLTRDYYRVEDGDGRRFWLFRHGLYGTEKPLPGWYLHGLFA